MLAALRVLHVDTSHTPATDAVIEERLHPETYQPMQQGSPSSTSIVV
jgi:hypothetical protein